MRTTHSRHIAKSAIHGSTSRSANDSCGAFGFTPAICDGICLKRLRSRNSAMPIAAASDTNATAEYGAMMPTSSTALMPDTLKR